MQQSENIYLIGLMGVGKTTIGRHLAGALKLPFYDSDKAIEESTGVDIPTIFEYEGEDGFRQREQKILTELVDIKGIVLATGGGAILQEKNRQLLMQNGFVVYLHCSIEKILQRTRRDNQRPLLNKSNPQAELEKLSQYREALYLECADFEINTDEIQSKVLVNKILEAYQQHN